MRKGPFIIAIAILIVSLAYLVSGCAPGDVPGKVYFDQGTFNSLTVGGTPVVGGTPLPGATGPAGPTGPQGPGGSNGSNGAAGQGYNFRGDWVSGTSYAAYDDVTYFGSTYNCIAAVSGTTTPDLDTGHWAVMAKGFFGEKWRFQSAEEVNKNGGTLNKPAFSLNVV